MKDYKITIELLILLYLRACESLESLLKITLQIQGVVTEKNKNFPVINGSIQLIDYIWRSRNVRH